MECISHKDREILREIAKRKLDFSKSEQNKVILEKWYAQAAGIRKSPTVRLLFSNCPGEIITPRMRCEGGKARDIEYSLLRSLAGRELFDDDTPVSDTFDITLSSTVNPYGTNPRTTNNEGLGFHIEPQTDDIERDFHIFENGYFAVDKKGSEEFAAVANDVIGDILPSRLVMGSLPGTMTYPLVMLIGMETYYIAMYDCSETLHKIMDLACSVYEKYFDYLENKKLLLPTVGYSPVSQETFAFTDELPSDKAERTTDVWGFMESQETTAVSPKTYGEFVYPYQDRLARRFGLLSYGCCERVDDLWEDYLSKWKNLRKLSVSPFNDEKRIGDYLRGSRVVFYSKPRAEYVTNPGPLDESGIREYFKGVAKAASGCLFEVAQREVGTVFGSPERGREYVRLAKEAVNYYWQP